MVDSDNSTRFPGWYADPGSSNMERFWDGRQWTGSTRDAATASAARSDVVVDLTGVAGMVPGEPAETAPVDTAASAPSPSEGKTPTFEADNGADGLFSQPQGVASRPSATAAPSRLASESSSTTAEPSTATPTPTPSALTGLFGKPDPTRASATDSTPNAAPASAEAAQPAPDSKKKPQTAPAAVSKPQPAAKSQPQLVENPTDTLSARDEVTRERLESAKAQLEAESKAATEAAPSMIDLLKPKDDATEPLPKTTASNLGPSKSVAPSGAEAARAKPAVTKAQARRSATSFPKPITPPQKAPEPGLDAAKVKPAVAKPAVAKPAVAKLAVESPKAKVVPKTTTASTPPSKATSHDLEGNAKKPWAALAVIAALCLAGGGFLLGFLAGGSGSGSTDDEVAATTEAPTTTIAEAEPVETTIDTAMEEAMVEAETRVEELEAEQATSAEQISSLEAEVDTLAAERDNEAAHNELLQSWFTADVLARSQGSWDFEVGRACALEAEPTIDDLNYSRRLEVIGTPADLLAAVAECRG